MVCSKDKKFHNNAFSAKSPRYDELMEIGRWLENSATTRQVPENLLLDQLEYRLQQFWCRPYVPDAFHRIGDLAKLAGRTPLQGSVPPNNTLKIFTSIPSIDELTNGFQGETLTIVAGAMSVARTRLLCDVLIHAVAEQGLAAAYFSMGTSTNHLIRLLLTCGTTQRASSSDTEQTSGSHIDRFGDLPLYLNDSPALSLSEIRAGARRLVRQQEKPAVIVIDSLSLMRGNDSQLAMEYRVDALKQLAKEVGCNVIATIDLPDTTLPTMDSLKAIGNIDHSAEVIFFMPEDSHTN